MNEFDGLSGEEFEYALRARVEQVNYHERGSHPTPWEVVMEAVIALERRLSQPIKNNPT